MDPHRIYAFAWVIVVYLLRATRSSSGANCKCPKIPKKEFTLPEDGFFNINKTYRYQCIQGYVRKAGESSLIKCEGINGVCQWTRSRFKCIPDPKYKPQPTTTSSLDVIQNQSRTQPSNWPGTSTSLQSDTTSASENAKSPNTEPAASGTSTSLQSDTTSASENAKSPNTEPAASGTSTSLQSDTTSASENAKSPNTEPAASGDLKTVFISLSVVILLFAMSGIIFLLYQRRNKVVPPRKTEELEPMNG